MRSWLSVYNPLCFHLSLSSHLNETTVVENQSLFMIYGFLCSESSLHLSMIHVFVKSVAYSFSKIIFVHGIFILVNVQG